MKNLALIALFVTCTSVFGQKVAYDPIMPLEDYNFVLGTQGIGGSYKFSETDSKLVEQSKHIRAMGSNILKISLGPKAFKSYGLPIPQQKVKTTLELFEANDDFKEVFDMDFKYIFAWVHSLTDVKWKIRINAADEKKLYNEMYEFASYLLTTYNDSGKTFMLGNWEGDWLLHTGYNREMTPPKEHIDNMTKWFQIRQRAVDDAKKDTKHTNVSLYHYIELNLALKGMKGQACIANDILPKVNVDFVSYSSYEAIKNRDFEEKKKTLKEIFEYLENQLPAKEGLPFNRRVFLGEYGYHANIKNPKSFTKQFNETKEIMKITMELDLPFALHWQMFNNEYKDGVSKQMSLISEEGERRPLYFFHQQYYIAMNGFLKDYKQKNGSYPDTKTFNAKALEVLETL